MRDYQITVVNQGLFTTTHSEYGRQVWSRCKLRKHQGVKCAQCDTPVGAEAFRPVTNRSNRMRRICTYCAQKALPK